MRRRPYSPLVAATSADETSDPSKFDSWLQEQLDARGWIAADLIRASGNVLTSPRLTNWLSGKEVPRLPKIRVVCSALGVTPAEGMIAAGHLRPEDVGATVVQAPRPWRPSKRQVLAALDELIPDDAVEPVRLDDRRPPVLRPRGVRGKDWAARDLPADHQSE